MNVKIEKLPNSRMRIRFEVPAETVNQYIDRAFSQLTSTITIPGFRQGKAPRHMLEAKIGTQEIHNKAIEMLFPFSYAEAITQEKVQAVGRPDVKVLKFAPNNTAEFVAEVSVLPNVELGDYKKLVIEKHPQVVKEEDIDKVIENLRRRDAKPLPKQGSIEENDWVEVNFTGDRKGVILERLCSKNFPFVVGSGTLLPDFEKNVIGLKEGEEKKFELKFPEDYNDKEIAGEKCNFAVKINKVQKLELPELNEEFIGKISGGNEKTIEGLREDIRKALEKQHKEEERIRIEEEVITQVTEKAKLEIPEDLIQDEYNEIRKDVENKLVKQGLDLNKYLEYSKKTLKQFEEELRKEAERKIKVGLVINEIAKKEQIEVSEDEREKEVNRIEEASKKNPQAEYKEDETRRYVTIILKHRKVIERLLEYANK